MGKGTDTPLRLVQCTSLTKAVQRTDGKYRVNGKNEVLKYCQGQWLELTKIAKSIKIHYCYPINYFGGLIYRKY